MLSAIAFITVSLDKTARQITFNNLEY